MAMGRTKTLERSRCHRVMVGHASLTQKYLLYLGVSWKLHMDTGIAGVHGTEGVGPEQVLRGFHAEAFERAFVSPLHGHISSRTFRNYKNLQEWQVSLDACWGRIALNRASSLVTVALPAF
jgi:hypothetical protein